MNNRDYKQFAAGEIYHVYNRGVGKMDIFRDHDDFDLVRSRLREAFFTAAPVNGAHSQGNIPAKRSQRKPLPPNAFTFLAYCLMPNHYHLLIRQNTDLPISALMLSVFGGYSKCFNKKYERVGPLFQDQFKAVHIDSNEYLRWISAYIHANPLVARLVTKLEDYPYSSYLEYTREGLDPLCEKEIIAQQFSSADEYAKFVAEASEITKERKDLEQLFIDV